MYTCIVRKSSYVFGTRIVVVIFVVVVVVVV